MASRKMLAYFSILNIKLHIYLVILSLSPSHRHLTQGNKAHATSSTSWKLEQIFTFHSPWEF